MPQLPDERPRDGRTPRHGVYVCASCDARCLPNEKMHPKFPINKAPGGGVEGRTHLFFFPFGTSARNKPVDFKLGRSVFGFGDA